MKKETETTKNRMIPSQREAVAYIGMGMNCGRRFLDQIGATVKIGKRVVFDREVIDRYFDSLAAGK